MKETETNNIITHKAPNDGISYITILRLCVICKESHFFTMPTEDFRRWAIDRVLIQKALPYFTPDEREMLITQICPKCQKPIFEREQ